MDNKLSLELKHISKTFPGVKALNDVSFSAQPGKVCGIVGVNGAGKSTLMNILGGIHQPDDGGEIIINGQQAYLTSSLSDHEVAMLFQVIRKLREQGYIIFYISHFLDEIFDLCDNVVVLRDGQVVGQAEIGDINKEQLVEMMLGYQVEGRVHNREVALEDVIFKAEHISGEKLPKDFSFELHRGEILGVWGLLGSGRSELFNTLLGIDKMMDGKLWFKQDGELREITQRDFYKHVGYLTEGRHYDGLFLQMPICQNITSSDLDRFAAKGIGVLNSAKEHAESRNLIEQVGVKTPDENVKVSKLSGGNQQKVIIAKWFLKDPEILFMDEPTELEEIMSLCDRIIVIYEGRLVGEVMKADFSKESLMKGIVSQEEKDAE